MPGGDAGTESALVTGASGFIGSATVRALLGEGYRVRVLIEPQRSDDKRIFRFKMRVEAFARGAGLLDDRVYAG